MSRPTPPKPTRAVERESHSYESISQRLREGSRLVDEVGEFQKAGDRIHFVLKDGGSLRVLENLALERVFRLLEDDPALRTWSVSGSVTEFRGDNYLILTRAILKSRSDLTAKSGRNLPASPAGK